MQDSENLKGREKYVLFSSFFGILQRCINFRVYAVCSKMTAGDWDKTEIHQYSKLVNAVVYALKALKTSTSFPMQKII
jgi:hypothetical protein